MWTYWTLVTLLTYLTAVAVVHGSRPKRETTDLEPGNWNSCKEGGTVPPTRVDTTDRVSRLRTHFADAGIQAYMVPSADAHQSEYPSQYDKRRGYMTGFQGSAGVAVITTNKQAMWTDGRYFLEAEDTLDCNWILMRQNGNTRFDRTVLAGTEAFAEVPPKQLHDSGEPGVPTIAAWLKKELRSGDTFGASPFLVGSSSWEYYKKELLNSGINMVSVSDELVDKIWSSAEGRPEQPNTPINVLPLQFSGRAWQDKVSDMRHAMEDEQVDMMVVAGLDETAWLFNLRASDIQFNPFFISYAVVGKQTLTLYLLDHTTKLAANPTDEASTVKVAEHLNTNNDGTCTGRSGQCVEVKTYDPTVVVQNIKSMSESESVNKVWLGYNCNFAIYSTINESKILQENTPIATTKIRKNHIEREGMKNSHIRDAVALVSFLAKLEKEVKLGKKWTELTAARALDADRGLQQYNRGTSFSTISSFGPNGAIIHYSVTNVTSIDITTNGMYLLDSGGQYLDGTTDVTRTLHFGTPTDYQKECYTRVMMGHINLFQAKWPRGMYGRDLDAYARGPLWDVGLVYRHGTGHGIGMYLSVHEGPAYMRSNPGSTVYKQILDEFLFISNEPGYYQDGEFGVRLENIVMVKNATTAHTFPGTHFLEFEHVTLVPYEPNLIKYDLLSDQQIRYLNEYNKLVRDIVGPELKKQGKMEGYDWMISKTKPTTDPKTSSGVDRFANFSELSLCLLSFMYIIFV